MSWLIYSSRVIFASSARLGIAVRAERSFGLKIKH